VTPASGLPLGRRCWKGGSSFSDQPVDGQENLFGFREAAGCLLRENQLSVHFHLENASAGRDELGFNLVTVLDLGSQTDCLGIVVSNLAEFDGDMH
jgi:hypothetical protein